MVQTVIATQPAVLELAYSRQGWVWLRTLCLQQGKNVVPRLSTLTHVISPIANTVLAVRKSKPWRSKAEILEPPLTWGTTTSPSPQMKEVRCFPIHTHPHNGSAEQRYTQSHFWRFFSLVVQLLFYSFFFWSHEWENGRKLYELVLGKCK